MRSTSSLVRGGLWAALALTFPVFAAAAPALDGNEWPNWRGPERNGVSRAKGLISSWATEEENLLWKVPFGGRSTPAIFGGRIYVLRLTGEHERRQEQLVCLDADTGKQIWDYKMDVFMTDIGEERVGWTSPTVDPETGYVYIQGSQGFFTCFDRDGKVIWTHSLGEEFGKISGFGARTITPAIDGDLVIVGFNNSGLAEHAKPSNRFLAADKKTGEIRWWHTPDVDTLDTNYSWPAFATINGTRLMVVGGGTGYVHAIKVATGEGVWKFRMGPGPVNVAPVIEGDRVYVSYSEENVTGRIVCINAAAGTGDISETGVIWEEEGHAVGYSSSTLYDGKLITVENNGTMRCLNAADGKPLWKLKVGKGSKCSPVAADGKIYYMNLGGGFLILQPGEKDCKILSKLDLESADGFGMDLTGSVAVAYGRIYFLTREWLYCLGNKDHKPAKIEIAATPAPEAGSGEAAHIQIRPADIQIAKDAKAAFKAYAYDAKGRLIGEAKDVQWSLAAGPPALTGKIENSVFTPDPSKPGQFGKVEAKLGALTGVARVRVMPSLPINTDFSMIPEGATPGSWVGCSKVKFTVVKENGDNVLMKLFDTKILNSNVYMTTSKTSDYTIQADVRGSKTHQGLPDVGLINCRYTLRLYGETQKLGIVGWVPRPSRITKMIDFAWSPDVWHTIKFKTSVKGGKGLLQGKAWKRGEPEPKDWMIEIEDPEPYEEGSPGLTVYPMSEAYYDNVKVEKN